MNYPVNSRHQKWINVIITATGETKSMLDAHARILNISHRLREIHKADRLKFKIVPNRHQATDFYQIKIELYRRKRYGTNVTVFFFLGGGVFQVIDMSAQLSWRRCYFINARICKLESNCDEANRHHLFMFSENSFKLRISSCCTFWGFCCTLMRQCNNWTSLLL